MNYEAFTNDSLTMMYEGIRGALAADDALKGQGEEPRFRVRGTPDWKLHASELLEAEMSRFNFHRLQCMSLRDESGLLGRLTRNIRPFFRHFQLPVAIRFNCNGLS
jgi:hypothetical protein